MNFKFWYFRLKSKVIRLTSLKFGPKMRQSSRELDYPEFFSRGIWSGLFFFKPAAGHKMAQHKKLGGPLQQRFYDCCMNVKSAVIWRRNAGKVLSLSENNEPTFELLFDYLRLASKQPFYLELLRLLAIFFRRASVWQIRGLATRIS